METRSDYTMQNSRYLQSDNMRLNSFKAEDKNYEAQNNIDKGLNRTKAEKSTEEVIKQHLAIPSPYVLNINNVESEHDGQKACSIYTSQQLSAENITKYIKVSSGS